MSRVTATSQGGHDGITGRLSAGDTPALTVSIPSVPELWISPLTLYRAFLAAAGRSPKTVRLRLHYLGRLAGAFPDPWGVEPAELLTWIADRDWSPETRKSARASVTGFYRWASDYGMIGTNPARLLPSVRVPRALPRPAPETVVEAAVADASPRDRLMIMLAAYAGLRRAEIAGLPWSDVLPDSLHVTGKGGRQRVIPLLPEVAGELRQAHRSRATGSAGRGWRYQPETFSPYVFPGARGGHIHADTVGKILAARLGPGWSGHTLRHRFGTKAYAGTRDIRAVQELLGHASPNTTARYTAIEADQLRAAVESAGRAPARFMVITGGQPRQEAT